MIRYTCANCNRELRCLKNEIPLIHFLDNDRNKGIDVFCFGDLWECEKCGCKVVLGLGKQILGLDVDQEKILKREFVEVTR